MSPARRRAARITLASSLFLLGLPALAHAGSYASTACSPYSTPGQWTQSDSEPSDLAVGNQCGGPLVGQTTPGAGSHFTSPTNDEGALYAQDVSNDTVTPAGTQAGWTFTAPAGTTITAVTFYSAIGIFPGRADFIVGMFQAKGASIETCQGTFANNYYCQLPNNQIPQTFTGLDTSGLFFGIKCQPDSPGDTGCQNGAGGYLDAQADMYSASVTLTESATPSISGESGLLWSGGVVSGTVPLMFSASDVSGIANWSIAGPSSTLYTMPQGCDYTQATPCPQLNGQQQNVDTTRLPDGPQTITISVTDAAGNTTTATSPTVVIDNNGPPAPTGLTATAAGPGSNAVNLAWTNPASLPQPLAAAYAQLCAASCTAPVQLADSGTGQLTAPGPGNYSVRLWLTDAAAKGGTNVATTPVTVPAVTTTATTTTSMTNTKTKPAAPKLTITHRLHRSRLTLTVHVPAGVHGSVWISYDAYRGRKRVAFARKRIKPRHGIARATFTLSNIARGASRLTVYATATGATAVTANLARHTTH